MKLKITILLLSAAVSVLCLFNVQTTSDVYYNKKEIYEEPGEEYLFKSENNQVFLFRNGEIVKEYTINIQLLPGEDIKVLSEGIEVDSVEEADRLAEDFDG